MTKSICSVEDCGSFVKGHGWCGKHYKRWRTHGSPEVSAQPRTCRYCDELFTPTNGRQVVCVGCEPAKLADYQVRSRPSRRAWRTANNDRLNELNRIKRARDRAASRAYAREKAAEWRLKHPGYLAEAHARRKARAYKSGVFVVTPRDKKRISARYGDACAYCLAKGTLEWDHVVPIARGGRHSIGNLVPSCRTCNASKNARTVTEWRVWQKRMAVYETRKGAA